MYEKFSRAPADTVEAGDICAVCGIDDIQVIIYFWRNLLLLQLTTSYIDTTFMPYQFITSDR